MKWFTGRKLFAAVVTGLFLLAFPVSAVVQSSPAPQIHQRRPPEGTITLRPVLVPPVGTEAVFVLSESSAQRLGERTGLFMLVPAEDLFDGGLDVPRQAVRAHYTVLEPDPDSGDPRVLVRAQPIDPDTYELLSGERWEAIYVIRADGVKQEGDVDIPDGYRDLVKPDWLTDWTMTPAAELPQGAIAPGYQWQSAVNLEEEWGEFPFEMSDGTHAKVPLTGQFVGWEQLPYDAGRAAHVAEVLATTGTVTQEFAAGIEALMTWDVTVDSRYWLRPNDFPYRASQTLVAGLVMAVNPDSGAPEGVAGSLGVAFDLTRHIEANLLASEEWLEYRDPMLRLGEPVSGDLGPWSETIEDGSYVAFYAYEGTAGEHVVIRLESDDFDAVLMLFDDEGGVVDYDDDSGGGTNAMIRTTLPYTGWYTVAVNAVWAGEAGSYTLSVELTESEPLKVARAAELIARLDGGRPLSAAELAETEGLLQQLLDHVRAQRRELENE